MFAPRTAVDEWTEAKREYTRLNRLAETEAPQSQWMHIFRRPPFTEISSLEKVQEEIDTANSKADAIIPDNTIMDQFEKRQQEIAAAEREKEKRDAQHAKHNTTLETLKVGIV